MREFQERRRLKKLLHSRYAIAVLVVISILLIRGVWGVYEKYRRSENIASKMRVEYEALKGKESALSASIAELDTPEGKERELRDRFGAVKEGERLIILVDEAAPSKTPARPEEKGFWRKAAEFFFRD